MKNIYLYLLSICFILFAGLSFTSCEDENSKGGDEAFGIKVYSPTKVIPGQEVIITGAGLNEATEIIFPGDIAVTSFTIVTPNMITVITPANISTEGGQLFVKSANETIAARVPMTVGNTNVRTIMPNDTISIGKEIQIYGTDMEFIKQIIFPAGPLRDEEGNLVLDANGKETPDPDGKEIVIEAIDFVYRATGQLRVKVPRSTQMDAQIKLVDMSGQVHPTSSVYILEPPTGHWVPKEFVLWEGKTPMPVMGNPNWEVPHDLYLAKADEAAALGIQMKVGTIIRLTWEETSPEWAFQFFDGRWGQNYGYLSNCYRVDWENAEDNGVVDNHYDIIVDAGILPFWNGDDYATNYWGSCVILQGQNLVFTRISIVYEAWEEITEGPQMEIIWEGSKGPISWSESDGRIDLEQDKVDIIAASAGKTLGIDFDNQGGAQIRVMGAWWGVLPTAREDYNSQWDVIEFDNGTTNYEFTLNQGDIDILTQQKGFMFGGGGLVVKRIYIR